MDAKALLLSKPVVNIAFMLSLKFFNIQPPVLMTRVLWAVCMVIHFGLMLLLLQRIRSGPAGASFKAKEVDKEQQKVVMKQYTAQSYDDKQCREQLQSGAIASCITLAMHAYKGFTAPMLLACTQPFFLAADPVFKLRVLGIKTHVQRPKNDAMKKMQLQMMEAKTGKQANKEKASKKAR